MNRGPSIFLLDGTPADGHTTAEIEQALRAQVDRIAREGVTEAELKRVKAQVVAGQIYKRDSVFGQGMEIGLAEMTGLSWRERDRSRRASRQAVNLLGMAPTNAKCSLINLTTLS